MHTQCSPSRCTMLTGRFMHVLGHRTQTHLIRAYEENYLRLLKEAGYHVRWYGKNDAMSQASFNLSVSYWEKDIGFDSGHDRFDYGESGYWSMLYTGGSTSANSNENGDTSAVSKAIDWLKDDDARIEPFVLFLPTRGAHPPYGAPPEFQDKISLEDVKRNVNLRPRNIPGKPKYHSSESGIPFYRNLTYLSNDTFYEIQRSYLSMVSYTDWNFGRLLDAVDGSDLANRTALFYSSDHGDFGGDFGLIEKWPGGADDVLTRVPLIARVPGGVAGNVVRGPVQTADILETMVDMANVSSDGWVRFGKSLRSQIERGDGDDLSRTVYSEGGFSFHSELFPGGSDHVPDDPRGQYYPRAQEEMSGNGTGSPKFVMLRNMTHKLVYRPRGVSELYDLTKDPRELSNVYDSEKHRTLRAEMMSNMSAWLVETSDVPTLRVDKRGSPAFPFAIDEKTCETIIEPDPSRDPPQASE
eukprot:g210.t1